MSAWLLSPWNCSGPQELAQARRTALERCGAFGRMGDPDSPVWDADRAVDVCEVESTLDKIDDSGIVGNDNCDLNSRFSVQDDTKLLAVCQHLDRLPAATVDLIQEVIPAIRSLIPLQGFGSPPISTRSKCSRICARSWIRVGRALESLRPDNSTCQTKPFSIAVAVARVNPFNPCWLEGDSRACARGKTCRSRGDIEAADRALRRLTKRQPDRVFGRFRRNVPKQSECDASQIAPKRCRRSLQSSKCSGRASIG